MIKKLIHLLKIKDLSINLNYWKNPDKNNEPIKYLDNDLTIQRTNYLLDIFNKYFVNKNINILELGCNVGRNLNALYNQGYNMLTGIEINSNAIEIMKKHYYECYKNSIIINEPIENYIKNFKNNEFDVVFTMAVLEHIHKRSEWIFDEIMRITKYIITIEDEKSLSWKHFPRRYDKIFNKFTQIYSEDCSFIIGFNDGFMLRVFKK
ncbi:MAG: class I SAM-dependent methyltransferase [Melioribacteraceae bacterium]